MTSTEARQLELAIKRIEEEDDESFKGGHGDNDLTLEEEWRLDGDVLRGPGGLSVSSMQMKKVLLADDLWRGAQESWYYEHCCMSLVLVSHSPPPTPKAGHAHGEGNRCQQLYVTQRLKF